MSAVLGSCSIPDESVYHGPLAFLQQACEFIAAELASDKIGTHATHTHTYTSLSTPILPLAVPFHLPLCPLLPLS